jgi:hypothetical protein
MVIGCLFSLGSYHNVDAFPWLSLLGVGVETSGSKLPDPIRRSAPRSRIEVAVALRAARPSAVVVASAAAASPVAVLPGALRSSSALPPPEIIGTAATNRPHALGDSTIGRSSATGSSTPTYAPTPSHAALLRGAAPASSSRSLADDGSWPATSESRRLQARLAEPMQGCTERWAQTMREYAAWHRAETAAILAAGPAGALNGTKMLVYRCSEPDNEQVGGATDDCGGLSDRLAGMSQLLLTAMLHRWLFFAQWDQRAAAFDTPFDFDYSWSPALRAIFDADAARDSRRSYNFISCPFAGEHRFCPIRANASAFTHRVNYVLTNRGALQTLRREPEGGVRDRLLRQSGDGFGLTREHWGGCLLRALVQPSPEVIRRVRPAALQLFRGDALVVGLHRRMGDRAMHGLEAAEFDRKDEYWRCVWHHVRALERHQPAAGMVPGGGGSASRPVRVFFAVDNKAHKDAATAAFGADRVFVSPVEPRHIAYYQLRSDLHSNFSAVPSRRDRLLDTFGDWWLLSLADALVMPGSSGFSRSAASYGQVAVSVALENFQGMRFFGCDRRLRQDELSFLGAGL